jgi:uncharacterized protein (DUF3820 family)
MEMFDPILPFGKFRGLPASECPVKYLDWLIGQAFMKEQRNKELLAQIEAHLQSRADWRRMAYED